MAALKEVQVEEGNSLGGVNRSCLSQFSGPPQAMARQIRRDTGSLFAIADVRC
jgi:hypothetical protein